MQDAWHHLIAHPGARFVPRQLAGHIAPILGQVAIDEAQRLRYCGGWICRDADAETVEQLAAITEVQGIETSRFETEEPIAPCQVERVVTADLEGDRLIIETPHELVDAALDEVIALDLGIVGDPQPARDKKQQEMHRWAEGMLTGLTFPIVRQALLDCDLGRPNPQAFLALPGRPAFLRIERGTRFPTLVEEAGVQALDSWLLFFDRLLAALSPHQILPEVPEFWRTGTLERVLRHRIEERESRLSWLRAWLDVHGSLDRTDRLGRDNAAGDDAAGDDAAGDDAAGDDAAGDDAAGSAAATPSDPPPTAD